MLLLIWARCWFYNFFQFCRIESKPLSGIWLQSVHSQSSNQSICSSRCKICTQGGKHKKLLYFLRKILLLAHIYWRCRKPCGPIQNSSNSFLRYRKSSSRRDIIGISKNPETFSGDRLWGHTVRILEWILTHRLSTGSRRSIKRIRPRILVLQWRYSSRILVEVCICWCSFQVVCDLFESCRRDSCLWCHRFHSHRGRESKCFQLNLLMEGSNLWFICNKLQTNHKRKSSWPGNLDWADSWIRLMRLPVHLGLKKWLQNRYEFRW